MLGSEQHLQMHFQNVGAPSSCGLTLHTVTEGWLKNYKNFIYGVGWFRETVLTVNDEIFTHFLQKPKETNNTIYTQHCQLKEM